MACCLCVASRKTRGVESPVPQLAPANEDNALLDVPVKAGKLAKDGLDKTVAGVKKAGGLSKQVVRGSLDVTREIVLLGDAPETDVNKVYGEPYDAEVGQPHRRHCVPCVWTDILPGIASLTSLGSKHIEDESRASKFARLTLASAELHLNLGSMLMLNRLRRKAAQVTPLTRDLSCFVGKWAVVSETGRDAYLDALELNWMVRKVAASMATPPILFFVDEQSTLHSQQGPLFGRMVVSLHPQKTTTTFEEVYGAVSEIVSTWEGARTPAPPRAQRPRRGVTRRARAYAYARACVLADGDDGRPVLHCRTRTLGKQDVCDQRSRVDADGLLRVETQLTHAPGAPTVHYDRVYQPIVDESQGRDRSPSEAA